MNFCRSIYRKWIVAKRKFERKNEKKLRKGCVHNLLTGSLQKLLLSAAGITLFTQPLFAGSQSSIIPLGNQTKVEYNDSKKTHTITTTNKSGDNAFNAFKKFTLNYNEIANLQLPDNTKNLINFVNSKIDIQGTLNAIKNNKIGGNLYFLSSEGLILGKVGVINAGAFYAMTPTKEFMKKFINADKNEFKISSYDVPLIVDRKIANYNAVYNKGVTINPTGEIIIEGQINTINGIGLYSGGNEDNKKGIFIDKSASLNTFSKDNLTTFSSLVNVDGLTVPDATEIVENEGNIELVSTQNNVHHTSSVLKLATGFSSFKTANATAQTEVNGNLNSRGDINVTALAANGQVTGIDADGKRSYDSKNNKLSYINSKVVFAGNATATGNISLEAISDNENVASNIDVKDIALELLGGSVTAFPLNIDADALISKTYSTVEVKKDSVLDAKKQITINAISNSTQQEGVKTATAVSLNVASKSKMNRLLPAGAGVYAESESTSTVNFDGKAKSHYDGSGDDDSKAISLLSESNSEVDVSATAATARTNAPGQVAFALGKNTNKANLTIGENATFETKHKVEIQSITNSTNSVTAASKGNKSAYFMPAVALSLFNSDSTIDVNKSNINLTDPSVSFTINALNNIMSDELSAEAGITSPYPWQQAVQETKDATTAAIMDKLRINALLDYLFPDNDLPLPKRISSFSVTGAVAYGGGSHNAIINIKPGSKIITTGDLTLKTKLFINDAKYDVSSFNYPESSDDGNESAKTAAGLSVLVSNYDYNSKIVIDDSTVNKKTQLIGKNVSIDSSVEQPYNRVKVLVDSLKDTIDELKSYFTEDEHKEVCEKIKTSFVKLFESNGSGLSDVVDGLMALVDLAKLEGLTLEDGIPGRLINFAKAILEFKGYTNYANYSVSSYVNSADGNTKLDLSGSVFVGTNKAKSDLFVGKNTIINSKGNDSGRTISLSSKSDITNTALIGGIPLLAQNTGGEESISIGGSSIVHVNNSESKLLVAHGAIIGSGTHNVSKIQLNSYNNFKPVDIIIGASSASKGFNAMASVLVGNSKANVLIDNSVNIAADTVSLNAYNNTEATNIVGSIMLSENMGVGVGAAVTALTKESQVLYDDNDLDWQKIRKELGLRTTDPQKSEVTYTTATITADIVEAVAKTTGTINTIGVAGSVAVDDRSGYDKWTEKGTMVNDFLSDSTIDNGTDFLKFKLIGKIFGVDNQAANIPDPQQQQQNQQQAQDQAAANPDQDPKLSLTINGSVGVNKITNTTKVDLNKAQINFKNQTNSKVDVSAINSAHHLSFAGAAGITAQGGDSHGTTAGVDGSIALNLIDNTTESLLSDSYIYDAKQINSTAINGGETISVGLGLQVNAGTHDPSTAGSGAINASINLIDNKITAKADNVTNNTSKSSNKTNMVIAAYESDTQVTGGVSAAVGKQKGAVGASIDIAKINNTLTSEIANSNLANMKNVEINALQASTIVNAGIAAAVSGGTDDTFGFSGSGVYSELTSNNSANISKSTINSDALAVRTQDVRTSDKGVKSYEDNLVRNGKNVDFVEKDGKSFYTGLETASGTTELGTVASGRKGSLLVTASVSGAYGGVAVGLGAAINEIDNSFNVNVSDSNITSNKFDADAISHTDAITIGVGAAVSTDKNKGSGVGSAAWNSIRNNANIKFSKNTIKSNTLDLNSLNDSTLVGVGGAVSVSTGNGGVGASLDFNAIKNTANSELYGGSITGISSSTSELNIGAENKSNIWGIALSVGVSKKVAVAGTVVINEIENNASAQIGSPSASLKTNINNFKSFSILATDSADIRSLSGAVTGSKEVAVGGAVAVNQIGGKTLAGLENSSFNSNTTKLRAFSDSEIMSMAIGAGGSGKVAVQGASVVNDIFRDVSTKVNNSSISNTLSDFDAYAESVGKTGGLSLVGAGSKNVAVGAGVSVNRIGGKVSSEIASASFKLKSLYSEANSYKRITNIGVGGSGSGDAAVTGSVAYNGITGNTFSNVKKSTIEAENNISIVAKSDDTLNNYAGQIELSGKAAVGVSLGINHISGDTTAEVNESNITAKGKDSKKTVAINNVVNDSEINNKYASSSSINANYSLYDQRKKAAENTGLQIDSSSTHTLKSFVLSGGFGGAAEVNANVNVNIIDGETKAELDKSTLNKGLDGSTSGNVSVKASDYTNTAGFIGSLAVSGNAAVGASFDTNKVNRNTIAKASDIKNGSTAKDLQIKANSKQGFSSVVAGVAGSLDVGVAGNVSIGLNKGTTEAQLINSKLSVNSLDVEANHYARGHVLAGSGGVGITVAGVAASVVVTNDVNTVSADVSSSTVDINKNSGGDIKVKAINDDNFEAASASVGGGLYAGVAGAVAVNYIENKVGTTIASSTIGTSSNRAKSIEIKSKDVSRLEADGGTLAAGVGAVGASVFVNTYDGQTNTNISNSKLYSTKNVDLGAYEERNGKQYAVGVAGGVGAVGSNILVINSGKKLDVKESGSNDANTDLNAALGMAEEVVDSDYISNNNHRALTDDELSKIFAGKPTYTASKDGNSVTLTKIDKSVIDSSSGKVTSKTIATGTINLSNYGGAAGEVGVLGGFGFIYDNKNVVTSVSSSNINAGEGIDIRSINGGISNMNMIQACAGLGDYCGAFAYVKLAGNTSVGLAGSRLENKKDEINIIALDDASGKNDARGYTFGGASVGTIISKAKNNSSSDVTISNSRVVNKGSYIASNSINISSEKNNSLSAIGYSGTVSLADVAVVSTLAQDEGKSILKLGTGNYFEAKELNALASNRPDLYSKLYQWAAGGLVGVGVGDVTTREYGTAKLNAVAGSKYNVNTINLAADLESESSQESAAYTVTLGADIHVNRADTLSSSNVEVDVNIGKDDFSNNSVLNVYAENTASATMDVYGVSVGGVLSVANNSAKAIASLTTNVNVNAVSGSKLSQINVHSSSDAYHKLHANGDGGGLISISPYAASTESKMVMKTNTNLSKDLTADKITANAIGTAKGYLTSDATQGELVGGCGTQASYDYDLDTNVNVKENAKLTGNIVELKSQNNFETGAERKNKNNKTSSYGLETGSRIDSEQKITGTSQVNIGKNATILASKEINIDAKTQADLSNKAQLSGAGFGSHLGSHANNTITFNNNIILEEGSLLKTDKAFADINLASSYNIVASYSAYSEVEGAGEGNASAEVVNNYTINDLIDLKGDIYSYNDINLYTDKDSGGALSSFKMNNEAEAYTRAVVPWETSANIKNSLKRNNTININKNSDLKSIRHITLSAKDISLSIKNYTKEYNWYKGSDESEKNVCTVSEGKTDGGLTETDEINVLGKVTAGIHNNINVKIDGKVVFDTNITGDGVVRAPTIDCNTEEYKNAFKTGTMDYGNELFNRYLEVEKLYNEYSTTEQIKLSYAAEMQRLINEMEKYGLYDTVDKKVIAGLSVDYIELPDMVCSGGNIYINAIDKDSVKGTGKLKAQGAPKIKVENNSNLYMKVNDLTVVEPGGDIVFNNLSLGQNAKSTLSKVTTVETDDSKGSEIRVNENWKNRFEVNYKDPEDGGKIKTTTANPLTNIEINGHITDEYGNVIFYNANKDIVLQGKTAKDSASIDGAAISISAPNGSIAQGYTEGITNIGYTPEAVLKDYATQQENSIIKGKDLGLDAKDQKQNILTEAQMQAYVKQYQKSSQGTNDSASGVWLAGGSIYLNGEIINLNGIVQSGYSKFEVILSDTEKARIQTIKDNYNNSGKPQITESYLEQNCRINDSGMKWYKDAKTGVESYKYVVQAYYNPQTDSIVLEDVQSSGGKIYLTGKIVNTSGGKIYAADGSSDIDITNDTGYKLTANTLDVGDRQGFISIMDLAKSDDSKGILATLTEMTSDSTKVWYVTKDGTDRNKPDSTSGLSSVYNPRSGLTYNWSTGYKESYEYRYEETYKFTVWGAIDYDKSSSESLMKKVENGLISPTSSGKNDKITGRNVENPIITPSTGYSLYFQNNAQYRYGPVSGGHKKYNSWVHFSGKYYGWAEYKYGSTRDYQHSIKADYPISINFLSGSGNINLTTNSDLQLNSDVISKYGDVKLTSTNGSIEQTGGLFYADKIWLNATTGIGSKNAINQKMQSESGIFSAITSSGDVNLISKNKAGVKDAKLKLAAVTDKGNANVITDASMLQSGNAVDVKGSRIDLVSNYGSIGTKDALLKINAGQEIVRPGDTLSASVNAKAYGDVALNQTAGDMRIGKIISQFGDAYITSAGSVLDALPAKADKTENQEVERLIEKWKELGIISVNGKDNSAEKRAEAIKVYKDSVKTAFARYTGLKKRFAADNKDTTSETYKEYQKLKERFGSFTSYEDWLEAQNKDKNSQWYKLQNDVVFGWNQDALLYAIQDTIINRDSGSTITPKSADDANIKARNITIVAGGGIGRNDGYKVVDISNLQSEEGLEALKAIAAAEASDVKWGYNGDEIDENKATINLVNSIAIDASGKLKAYANDNIYFEEVNNHKINLESVKSEKGNVRVYGSNGIYNATSYKEGDANNIINLSGKDLIIESGDGSIGTKDVPVTTDMFGYITARSNDFINLYQIGQNAMTFAQVYSGAALNIRALNNILSVYSNKQSESIGYIHAKDDIILYSDQGDIGQSGGKGLRVKLEKGKLVNAEAESVYLKVDGDFDLNLGKITARSGDIGIESESLDLVLKDDIKSQNLEFIVRSLTQEKGKLSVGKLLSVVANNGITLGNFENLIAQAKLINNKSRNILLFNNRDLTLYDVVNKADDANIIIANEGSVTSKNGLSSNGDMLIWSDGDIDIQKDSKAKNWMGIYAEKGSIKAKSLYAGSIDLSAESNGLSANDIISYSYIKADVEQGDIKLDNLNAIDGNLSLITHDGNISSKIIEAKNDIDVIAYDGDLKVESIKSHDGYVEAVGYNSLKADNIEANTDFFVGSYGDVFIKSLKGGLGYQELLSDIFDNFDYDEYTSYLIGNNIKIDFISAIMNLRTIANGKFDVLNLKVDGKANITAYNDIDIGSIKTIDNLDITSHGDGSIKIKETITDKGILSISNEVGDIELEKVKAGNNVNIMNYEKGDIIIGELETYNGGSLYTDIKDGFFDFQSGVIDGEASIYSDNGNVLLTKINVGTELDARAKNGSIGLGLKTIIGGDATLKSDTESVVLSDAEVGGNMKISAHLSSILANAVVGGSMLIKGTVDGCFADTLSVEGDLIINTHTGAISVNDAVVGNNTYISIDDKGKFIEIENIQTGNDLNGSLIVVSHSDRAKENYIDIQNAVAANKLIINSKSDINLKSAYALNGKLEVKGGGDIVAELINAAKETYIATLDGLLKISKVISGDSISIHNLKGDMVIDDIITLNPEADIDILQLIGDIKVTNASSARDLKFRNFNGNIELEKVSVGNDISISGGSSVFGSGANVSINDTYAGNDIIIDARKGNVNITNSNIGNDLRISLNGQLDVSDVNVGSKADITSSNNSIANFNRFKSNSFDLIDKGQTNLNISDSDIGKSNINLNGIFDFTKSSSDDMTAVLGGKSNIIESKLGNADITNNSELLIEASEGGSIKNTNNNNLKVTKNSIKNLDITNNSEALIEDSTITSMTAANSVNSRIELTNNLTVGSLELTNKGNALIHNSTIDSMSSTNEGQLELTAAPVNTMNLSNKSNAVAKIHDTSVKSMTASNDGELNVNLIEGEKLDLTSSGNVNIVDSKIIEVEADISGNAVIDNLENKKMSAVVSGSSNIVNSSINELSMNNTGDSLIKDSIVNRMSAANEGILELTSTPVESLDLNNKTKGEASIHDTTINSMISSNDGLLKVNNITSGKLDITSSGITNIDDSTITNVNANVSGKAEFNNINSEKMSAVISGSSSINNSSITQINMTNTGDSVIKDSNVNKMSADNDGKFELSSTPVDTFNLSNKSNGAATIHDSKITSISASNDGNLTLNNITGSKLVLSSKGNNVIADSDIKSIKANDSGKLDVTRITSDNFELTSSGDTKIASSTITNINANISGKANIDKLIGSQMTFNVSGETTIGNSSTDKIKYTNSGKTKLNKLEVKANANIINRNGNVSIAALDVANNFDFDSNGGSINMSGIDVKKDFNFALAGSSGVKFTDIKIGKDFNVYAGKAVLNGATLDVGNNLNTYTYSKYSAPKANLRAVFKQNNGTAKATESEEGFTLILDQLNIGGGLYVDNPNVTIDITKADVGKNVDINAGKENIQIDELDVDGGSLGIKGDTGSVKLGEVVVDNDTNIKLGSGNLEVASLTSTLGIDFKVGGNITSSQNIETKTGSVNMIAGGNVDAYKVLAKQQGNIEAVNGDIIIGQIDGKTLVFKQDTNDKTLRIYDQANVETKITAAADFIDIEQINHSGTAAPLAIDFNLVNGRAMDSVDIRDVKTDTGVNMFNLVSMYGNIHVSNEIFNLTQTYLLKKGDLSNSSIKFRLFGDKPSYSKDPDIIAFFAPRVNHKNYADISFTNIWHPGSQDYYPLIAKGDYKNMFNQYTVVQEFETIRLAYEEKIDDLHNDVYNKFDFRKHDNSRAFYVDYGYGITSEGDTVNLDDVEIPVGVEFDSASGELKSVGSHVKPQPSVD